ncbi:MAG: U32 family peptidase, partial [Deltaproteobacteria bacterium]|nr:U32 family peptidase [Deltaproteobacteria bacterium]
MELTLGPVLFEWQRDEVFNFYEEVSRMGVDRVYLGEVVCVKKRGLHAGDMNTIATMLEKAGKKVVLSTLAVVSNEAELNSVRGLLCLPFPVEANDMSLFNMAAPPGRDISAGPHITAYNVPSIEFLKSIGVRRVTFPVELSRDAVKYNIGKTGIEAEVFAHGKVPLAFSWRCYASRAHGLTKTGCRHHCAEYPDGMEIRSLEGEPLFTVNGTSLLGAGIYT